MTIFLGADHAGYNLKESLKEFLSGEGYNVEDLGAHRLNNEDDYPDFIYPVALKVSENSKSSKGIVIGGSGQGEAMAANRIKGVRAAVYYGQKEAVKEVDAQGREGGNPYELIRLCRLHNDANVLSIGARFVAVEDAKLAVKTFLDTEFSGDERHTRRIEKID